MEKDERKTRWLHVRLSEQEEKDLDRAWKKTTERQKSDYVRKIILGKPMIGAVRNQSLQDIYAELSILRKDLNGMANNFNQVVKKLHTWPRDRTIDQWMLTFRIEEKNLLKAVEEMKSFISQTASKWLQE